APLRQRRRRPRGRRPDPLPGGPRRLRPGGHRRIGDPGARLPSRPPRRQRAAPVSARATVRSLAGGAIKRVAAGADVLRRAAGGVTILIYHRVGLGTGGEVDLDPATFDRQLAWLREHRRVLHLDDAL